MEVDMKLPMLYELSKNGKIKQWQIEVINSKVITYYGYKDGVIQKTERVISKGKNLNKINKTTTEEQALSEAKSKYQRQLDKGYKTNIAALSKDESLLPMLAMTYKPSKTKLPKVIAISEKLNGVRCVAVKTDNCVKLYSRNGKDYTLANWDIAKELSSQMHNGDILDGELYVHGWDFERIISAVKAEKMDTNKLQYHIFDVPSVDDDFSGRDVVLRSFKETDRVKLVKCVFITNANDNTIKNYHKTIVKDGYEGVIIRDADAKYLWRHRDKRLLKYKEFIDEEFPIVGYSCGTGNDEGAIVFKCHVGGKRNIGTKGYFSVRPKGEITVRRSMYNNGWSYIGKMLTVRFQNWSSEGVPIFPVGLSIRDYE
jgi:DNA ligase-1